MSHSNYSSYRVRVSVESARQRKRRLENERKQAEERQKREAEERRKLQLEEARKGAEVMEKAKELASRLREAETAERDSTHEEAASANKSSTAKDDDRKKLMKVEVADIRETISELPEVLSASFKGELLKIEECLDKVVKSGFDPFFLNSLEWARRNTLSLVDQATEKMQTMELLSREDYELIDDMVAGMTAVLTDPVLPDIEAEARAIITRIREIEARDVMTQGLDELGVLHERYKALLARHMEVMDRDSEREFVEDNIKDILQGMGYEVLTMQNNPALEKDLAGGYYLTPDGEAVRLSMGLDRAFHLELLRLEGEGNEGAGSTDDEMTSKSRRFCGDYDLLLERLRERNIEIDEAWRVPPEKAEFDTCVVRDLEEIDRRSIAQAEREHLRRELE